MKTAAEPKRTESQATPEAMTSLHDTARPRFSWFALLLVGGSTIAAHILGAGPLRGVLWGSHAYGFLPPVAITVCALAVVAVLLALRYGSWLAQGPLRTLSPDERWPSLGGVLGALGVLGSLVCFWVFRAGHTLWGDGRPLTQHVPAGERFHPLEPLTALLQHCVYALARPLFQSRWVPIEDVARDAIGLGSAVAGALFVPVAWLLATSFSARHRPDEPLGTVRGAFGIVPLGFLVLVAQGYVQLFFGYVENYTYYTLALGIYLLAAHRFIVGRAPLLLPAIALVLATALHLSAVSMVPSFVVLALAGLGERARRGAALRDLAVCAAVVASVVGAFSLLGDGYHLGRTLAGVVGGLWSDVVVTQRAYFGSAMHIRDFLNEQLLIGPLGLFLFLPLAMASLLSPARRDPGVQFSLASGAGYLGASWIAGDSNLGYSRNWDLLAPAGLVFASAGLHLVLHAGWRTADLRRWLLVAATLSLLHTVPWIAVNTSFDYSFERLKSLPLGLGRTEATVGTWHFILGEEDEATRWLERSLDAYPRNFIASYYLGEIAMDRRDYAAAAEHYAPAVQARPHNHIFRARLAEALIRDRRPELARAHLDMLAAGDPRNAKFACALGIAWLELGRPDSASLHLSRALALAPRDTAMAGLVRRLRGIDDHRHVLREAWPGLRVN